MSISPSALNSNREGHPRPAWTLDTAHSLVEFSARHMGISVVKGHFDRFEATVDFDEEDVTKSSIQLTLEAGSINTGNAKRDADLQSAQFLNVEQFPEIIFSSTRVEAGGAAGYRLTGDLTICGVSRPVTLEVEYAGQGKDPYGNLKAGFSAATAISRADFGVTWNAVLETGGLLVGDQVKIAVEVELKRPAG